MSCAVHNTVNRFYMSLSTVKFQTLLNVPHFMALLISLLKIDPQMRPFFLKKRPWSKFISQLKDHNIISLSYLSH